VIQAGQSQINKDINEIEKFIIKLRNPLYGIKVNKEGERDTSFKGLELNQWIKDNYKPSQENITIQLSDYKAQALSQQLLNLSHIIPLGVQGYKMEEFNLDTLYCFKTFDPIMSETDWLAIQGAAQIRYYQKREPVVLEDELQGSIYQIISGRCVVTKKNTENIDSLDLDTPRKIRARSVNKKGYRKTFGIKKDLFITTDRKLSDSSKEGRILGYISDPETFGEISFLTDTPATASILADTEIVQILEIDKAMLNIAFYKFPELAARFYHFIGTTLLRLMTSSLNSS